MCPGERLGSRLKGRLGRRGQGRDGHSDVQGRSRKGGFGQGDLDDFGVGGGKKGSGLLTRDDISCASEVERVFPWTGA